jgi:hypothetical protein
VPAEPRKTGQPKIEVGGVEVTATEIANAIDPLVISNRIKIP